MAKMKAEMVKFSVYNSCSYVFAHEEEEIIICTWSVMVNLVIKKWNTDTYYI